MPASLAAAMFCRSGSYQSWPRYVYRQEAPTKIVQDVHDDQSRHNDEVHLHGRPLSKLGDLFFAHPSEALWIVNKVILLVSWLLKLIVLDLVRSGFCVSHF